MNKKTNTVPYTNDRREGRTHPGNIEWNPNAIQINGIALNVNSREPRKDEQQTRRTYNRAQRRANGQVNGIPIRKSAARRQVSR